MNLSEDAIKFADDYQNTVNNKYCLNYLLTNYVDIKYDNIWSEDYIK
jgi:hypothetical protein